MKKIAIAAAFIALGACNQIPGYRIMQARATGEAALAQAENERRVRVTEAQARLDAARLTAQAEVIQAQGVAQANQIMSASLGGPDGYLRWKYINMLEESKDKQIIYVPTEAALPILEAGGRVRPPPEAAKSK